jgi:hypothetical protein
VRLCEEEGEVGAERSPQDSVEMEAGDGWYSIAANFVSGLFQRVRAPSAHGRPMFIAKCLTTVVLSAA